MALYQWHNFETQRCNSGLRDARTASKMHIWPPKMQIWPPQCQFWLKDANLALDRQSWPQGKNIALEKKFWWQTKWYFLWGPKKLIPGKHNLSLGSTIYLSLKSRILALKHFWSHRFNHVFYYKAFIVMLPVCIF